MASANGFYLLPNEPNIKGNLTGMPIVGCDILVLIPTVNRCGHYDWVLHPFVGSMGLYE